MKAKLRVDVTTEPLDSFFWGKISTSYSVEKTDEFEFDKRDNKCPYDIKFTLRLNWKTMRVRISRFFMELSYKENGLMWFATYFHVDSEGYQVEICIDDETKEVTGLIVKRWYDIGEFDGSESADVEYTTIDRKAINCSENLSDVDFVNPDDYAISTYKSPEDVGEEVYSIYYDDTCTEFLFDVLEGNFNEMVNLGLVNPSGNYYLLEEHTHGKIKELRKKFGILFF